MNKLWFRLSSLIIRVFGDIQLFPYPFFCLLWGDTQYKVKGSEVRSLLGLLQPGDIILRRYDKYLSGWCIPGFWTHVGLMATDETIIHATINGVIEEDILTFLRTDYIRVLRYEKDDKVVKQATEMSRSLLGKGYDFLFDSSNDEYMFCSELVKYCYAGVFDGVAKNGGAIPPNEMLKADVVEIHDSEKFRKTKES